MSTTTRPGTKPEVPDWFILKEAMRRQRWQWLGWTDAVFHNNREDLDGRATEAMNNAAKNLADTLEDLGFVIVNAARVARLESVSISEETEVSG